MSDRGCPCAHSSASPGGSGALRDPTEHLLLTVATGLSAVPGRHARIARDEARPECIEPGPPGCKERAPVGVLARSMAAVAHHRGYAGEQPLHARQSAQALLARF